MPFPHAIQQLRYWESFPPENETLAMLAQCFTTWRPKPWDDDRPAPERLQAEGVMGPAEFAEHFKRTGGKVEGMGPLPR